MGKTKEEKKIVEETETAETVAVEEVAVETKRDADFYKRHPGAIDGVIYE